jgi:hypothetical protein
MAIQILCIGDVVGKPGATAVIEHVGDLIEQYRLELVVCNAENVAGGSGITPPIYERLINAGVDVITMGDHVFRKKDIIPVMERSRRIIRPANMARVAAGRRWTVVSTKSGQHQVLVACLLGQMYMGANDSPWTAADEVLDEAPPEAKLRVFDFHAEATSEKIAMGYHLDGRATAVFGTHTHVPTADARVLNGGTAVISDVGMTGPYDGVLGRRKDRVLSFLTTTMPTRFDVATEDIRLCGCVVTADETTGRATAIERVEVCHELD